MIAAVLHLKQGASPAVDSLDPAQRRVFLRHDIADGDLLAELAGQDMVLRERGSVTRAVFEGTLSAADVRPGAIIEVESREGVGEAVAAGFGFSAGSDLITLKFPMIGPFSPRSRASLPMSWTIIPSLPY